MLQKQFSWDDIFAIWKFLENAQELNFICGTFINCMSTREISENKHLTEISTYTVCILLPVSGMYMVCVSADTKIIFF